MYAFLLKKSIFSLGGGNCGRRVLAIARKGNASEDLLGPGGTVRWRFSQGVLGFLSPVRPLKINCCSETCCRNKVLKQIADAGETLEHEGIWCLVAERGNTQWA